MALEQEFFAADKSLHDLKAFDCGKPAMNEFLARYAIKHGALGLSLTYVLPEKHTGTKAPIAAYYTLASSTITRETIPTTQSLPSYPVPVVILARLAVHKHHQGRGLGGKTLVYALRQAARLTKSGLPAYGLILDAIDEQALAFYQHYGIFDPCPGQPMRLFTAMKTIEHI